MRLVLVEVCPTDRLVRVGVDLVVIFIFRRRSARGQSLAQDFDLLREVFFEMGSLEDVGVLVLQLDHLLERVVSGVSYRGTGLENAPGGIMGLVGYEKGTLERWGARRPLVYDFDIVGLGGVYCNSARLMHVANEGSNF